MSQERVRASLARAQKRRKMARADSPGLEDRIRKALATPGRPGLRRITGLQADRGTGQRLRRPRPFEDGAGSVVAQAEVREHQGKSNEDRGRGQSAIGVL